MPPAAGRGSSPPGPSRTERQGKGRGVHGTARTDLFTVFFRAQPPSLPTFNPLYPGGPGAFTEQPGQISSQCSSAPSRRPFPPLTLLYPGGPGGMIPPGRRRHPFVSLRFVSFPFASNAAPRPGRRAYSSPPGSMPLPSSSVTARRLTAMIWSRRLNRSMV